MQFVDRFPMPSVHESRSGGVNAIPILWTQKRGQSRGFRCKRCGAGSFCRHRQVSKHG